MASSTPIRLPWRLLTRAVGAANPLIPSTHYIRTQQPISFQRPAISRNYSEATPPPEIENATPPSEPTQTPTENIPVSEGLPGPPRLPRAVQAVYLRPLRRQAEYGVPSCDLQLRSYSIRNLEFFCDFALRAAYYLGLPASGPVPLPRITERWTVPRASFVYKKSQENFERRTVRRLIQIKDGNPETVELWLAFLQKHAYYGIGMKANVFEFAKVGVGKNMDLEMEKMKDTVGKTWDRVGVATTVGTKLTAEEIIERVNTQNFRAATHGNAPLSKLPGPVSR